jgi:hypothetical protein
MLAEHDVDLVRINIGIRWHTAAYSGDRKGSYVTKRVTKARRLFSSRRYALAGSVMLKRRRLSSPIDCTLRLLPIKRVDGY